MSTNAPTREPPAAADIQPFTVTISQEAIDDLRRRILATRWPTRELVSDRSQGVQPPAVDAPPRARHRVAARGPCPRRTAGRPGGDDPSARPLLGERLRHAPPRDEVER